MSDIFDREISIIGAGRVATSLAHALFTKGFKVNEIYSRSIVRARALSNEIPGSTATDSLNFSDTTSHLLIIAIHDDAISQVSDKIIFPKEILIAHTSGTVSLNVLQHTFSGIFYPLQTFTNEKKVDFRDVPILIDGKNEQVVDKLLDIGNLLSSQVKQTTESERQKLHLAAVFASNFTNRMLAAAESLLSETSLDLKILAPLVMESIQNAFDSAPDVTLTGPAKRGDEATIKRHLELLKNYPSELSDVYEKITASITNKS